jgi:hypothetical protein
VEEVAAVAAVEAAATAGAATATDPRIQLEAYSLRMTYVVAAAVWRGEVRMRSLLASVLAIGFSASMAGAVLAQDEPAPKINLSGTYEIGNANVGEEWVTLDFKATVTNLGEDDLSGPVVLRHPNMINKVYERFGDQSIPAKGSATVSGNVRVPRAEYDGWTNGGPALFFYMENDRGEIKTFRIPLSKVGPKAS